MKAKGKKAKIEHLYVKANKCIYTYILYNCYFRTNTLDLSQLSQFQNVLSINNSLKLSCYELNQQQQIEKSLYPRRFAWDVASHDRVRAGPEELSWQNFSDFVAVC